VIDVEHAQAGTVQRLVRQGNWPIAHDLRVEAVDSHRAVASRREYQTVRYKLHGLLRLQSQQENRTSTRYFSSQNNRQVSDRFSGASVVSSGNDICN
jgi:hypothetical protein